MIPTKEVVVYTVPGCTRSEETLDYLSSRGSSPEIHNVVEDSPEYLDVVTRTGSGVFPLVFVDSRFVGSLEEVKKVTLELPTEFRKMEMSGEISEPMCVEEKEFDRFILFNGKTEYDYADIHRLYKQQSALYWVVEEIDLSDDLSDWENASENERDFIKLVLAFFASLDQIVMENIGVNFSNEIVIPQVRNHFAIQDATEAVHGETYALLIQTYIKDPEEQRRVLRSVQTMPIIQKKALWVSKWMNPDTASLAERLVGFTCVEGVQFSGSFCAIYWLKKQGKFKGLSFANSMIARDEGLHAMASVLIYKHLENKLPVSRVHEIFRDAVEIECEFIEESLPVALIGINQTSMSEYIRFVADYWLAQLGYDRLYFSKNPFEWMDMISLEGKTNFFENRVAEYSKPGVLSNPEEQQFSMDADF